MPLNVIAVIPAHNEADRIAETLDALQKVEGLGRLIVVNDGSRDPTAEISRSVGAEVLECAVPGKPCGKGQALVAGISHARRYGPDVVLFLDADLGSSAGRLARLTEALSNDHPVSIAAFPPSTGGGFGLVKRYARWEILRRAGYSPEEPLSGQRALRSGAIDALPGIAPGFGAEVGMTLDLLAVEITPLEVPLSLEHRPTGRNLAGFSHRARQGFDILRALQGARIPW